MIGHQEGGIPAAAGGITVVFLQCLIVFLISLLIALQYRLWVGENGLSDSLLLKKKILQQEQKNAQAAATNRRLSEQVVALKSGLEEIESRAREDLGMIKSDETFFRVVEQRADNATE